MKPYARKGNGASGGEKPPRRVPPLPWRQRLVPRWYELAGVARDATICLVIILSLGLVLKYDPSGVQDAEVLIIWLLVAIGFGEAQHLHTIWHNRHPIGGRVPEGALR